MTNSSKLAFTIALLQWNSMQNKREMPWKGEKNPYRVWLSEIILQQTRVDQGTDYYNKFIRNYPTIEKLAATSDEVVFKDWEGLGYYSRCRNLLYTARHIVKEYKGNFPGTYEKLIILKGIGPYTAAAIASFAFNEPRAVLDGNVFRVLSRFFAIKTPIDSTAGKKQFAILAQELLDKKKPALFNQAIMDFGAIVCKPAPICSSCTLQSQCMAFKRGEVMNYPVKEKKLIKKKRFFQYLIMENEGKVLVRQRDKKDIWQGLYEFVQLETNAMIPPDNFINSNEFKKLASRDYRIISTSQDKQELTHQTIHAFFVRLELKKLPAINGYTKVLRKDLGKMAFPKLLQNYL